MGVIVQSQQTEEENVRDARNAQYLGQMRTRLESINNKCTQLG